MNTKTMRLPPRRDSTTAKRKDREDFVAPKLAPVKKLLKPTTPPQSQAGSYKAEAKPESSIKKYLKPPPPPPPPPPPQFQAGLDKAKAETKPESSNQLLAGYLAHEFLTKGTLFGRPFDTDRSEAVLPPLNKAGEAGRRGGSEKEEEEEQQRNRRRYGEVASLLKVDGAHIKDIVNPAQLARFINMQ